MGIATIRQSRKKALPDRPTITDPLLGRARLRWDLHPSAKRYPGKVVVITGAASGIGQATALMMAQQGAAVAAIDRSTEESQETIDKIQHSGGKAASFLADVSKPEEVQRAIDAAAQ